MKVKTPKIEREPSSTSLREIPEVAAPSKAAKRGHFHAKAKAAGGYYDGPGGKRWRPLKRGRPKKGEGEAESTSPRSIRFPAALWERLDAEAKKRGTTRHALLRELVSKWLSRAA